MKNSILVAALIYSACGAIASAQDVKVPKRVKFKNPPQQMRCETPVSPFSEAFHTKGQRSEKTEIKGRLFIICPTRYASWKGKRLPINWFDDKGNGYTDCDGVPNQSHSCWVTLPQ